MVEGIYTAKNNKLLTGTLGLVVILVDQCSRMVLGNQNNGNKLTGKIL